MRAKRILGNTERFAPMRRLRGGGESGGGREKERTNKEELKDEEEGKEYGLKLLPMATFSRHWNMDV